jgi:hypothetical protein
VADTEPTRDDTPLDFSARLADKPKKTRAKRGSKSIKLSRTDIRSSLYTLGGTLNGLVKSIPRNVERAYQWADDALDDEELEAFIDALTLSLEHNQRALLILERMGKVTPHVALVNVSLIIVLRRLARRKLISEDVANALTSDNTSPVPMETGGTPSNSWGHGDRENGTSVEDIGASPVYAGVRQ